MHAMAFNALLLFCILALVTSWASLALANEVIVDVTPFNRSSFPPDFTFGAASSAYQYEGAAMIDGRGPSIWDTFTHKFPEKIADGSNGDVALDQYHRYKEDVGIMTYMNLDAYRFSISWSRILPEGRRCGGINEKGVDYYNKLINELVANGIQPFVTIFHWDVPQALEDEYGGFLSRSIINDFRDFADLCFELFGDRVKHWITVNEPSIFTENGYVSGTYAPGRCSKWMNNNCTGGDSAREPYVVAHNILLAHAQAVKVYREKHQAVQKGKIGITLAQGWIIPISHSMSDNRAAQRSLDFTFGWFMDPLTAGRYPLNMRNQVRERLPKFSPDDAKTVKGSFDFIGINYYTSNYATSAPCPTIHPSYLTDSHVKLTTERNGIPIGPRAASEWLYIYPKGLYDLLLYIKKKYHNPLVYITENGMDEWNDPSLSIEESLIDTYRIDYYYRHLFYVRYAIRDYANVKGYFAWSLLDDFEWSKGYTIRFGINFVDYNDNLKRYPKLSATWFKNFLIRDEEMAKLDIPIPKTRWNSSIMIKEEKTKPKGTILAF